MTRMNDQTDGRTDIMRARQMNEWQDSKIPQE